MTLRRSSAREVRDNSEGKRSGESQTLTEMLEEEKIGTIRFANYKVPEEVRTL